MEKKNKTQSFCTATCLMESSDTLYTWAALVIYLIRVLLENTKDPWFGVLVYANIGMNTQLISAFTSAHTLNNWVEEYYV